MIDPVKRLLHSFLFPSTPFLLISWSEDEVRLIEYESGLLRKEFKSGHQIKKSQLHEHLQSNYENNPFLIIGIMQTDMQQHTLYLKSNLADDELESEIQQQLKHNGVTSYDQILRYELISKGDFEDVYSVQLIPAELIEDIESTLGESYTQIIYIGHELQKTDLQISESSYSLILGSGDDAFSYHFNNHVLSQSTADDFDSPGNKIYHIGDAHHLDSLPVPNIPNEWNTAEWFPTYNLSGYTKNFKNVINFASDGDQSKFTEHRMAQFLHPIIGGLAAVILVLLIALGGLALYNKSQTIHLSENRNEFQETQQLLNERNSLIGKVNQFFGLELQRSTNAYFLNQFENLLPPEVAFTSIELAGVPNETGLQVIIEGRSKMDQALYQFIGDLEKQDYVKSVELMQSTRKNTEYALFNLLVQMN